MGVALETVTYSKANITGGAYEQLAVIPGDPAAVRAFQSPGIALLLDAWAIDSDNKALFDLRSPRLHDNVRGILMANMAAFPGGVGNLGAQLMFPGGAAQPFYSSDPVIAEVNGTAADDAVLCTTVYYSDLPGSAANLHSWAEIKPRIKNYVGILVQPTASATPGQRGAAVALNSVDQRLKANVQYAYLGALTDTPVTLIGLYGADTGNYRIGVPGLWNPAVTRSYLVDHSLREGLPLIPVINATNQGATNVDIVNAEANTAPNVTLMFAELAGTF